MHLRMMINWKFFEHVEGPLPSDDISELNQCLLASLNLMIRIDYETWSYLSNVVNLVSSGQVLSIDRTSPSDRSIR